MEWWKKKTNEKGEDTVELPKEIQEQLNLTSTLKTQVEEQGKKLAQLDEISTFVREERARRAEEVERAKHKPATKTAEEEGAESEELAALLLTDPKAAYAKLAGSTNAAVMLVRADNVKREVFEDNAEKYPYYVGEVKAEINKILSKQTLTFRNDPEALENTYYTVVGKMQKDISEGKIKDRFASAAGSSRRSKEESEGDERKITVATPEIERAAKLTGISVADYLVELNRDVEAYI